MSPVVTEANVPDPRWRDEILQRIKRDPNIYLDIGHTYQSDPMICKATLLACEKVCFQRRTLEMVMSHTPHFDDYKAAFLHFVQYDDLEWMVKGYKEHFGSETGEDMKFLKRAIQRDSYAIIFDALPPAMRMDSELLQLAVENVCIFHVHRVLQAVPPEALAENEFILLRAVGLHQNDVPHFFWQNGEFIIKWLKANRSVASIPRTVFSDREMCLLMYRRSLFECESYATSDEIVDQIPTSFRADKSFVLECLNWHPRIFQSCDKMLQEDFDVFAVAAFAAFQNKVFPSFVNYLPATSISLVGVIPSRLEPHAEFTTFLACSWKSRQTSILPLSALDCDDDTARGLNTTIARYVGFHSTCSAPRLKQVWNAAVSLVIADVRGRKLIRYIAPSTLVQGVLKAIQCHQAVSLRTYPDELWSNSLFVNWASERGVFSKAISDEFSMDRKICLEYYERSGAVREKILPWISESLKSDKDFVLQCLGSSPVVLSCCKKDFLYDFEVLLKAVHAATTKDEFDHLVETALKEGWHDALVLFAKSIPAKIEAYKAIKSFDKNAGAHFFSHAPAVKQLVGSYLGIELDATKCQELQFVWSNHFIFCLAAAERFETTFEAWTQRKRDAATFKKDDSDDA